MQKKKHKNLITTKNLLIKNTKLNNNGWKLLRQNKFKKIFL